MNVSEWADTQGVHPQTAYRWFRQGRCRSPRERWGDMFSSAISRRHALMRA